MMFEFSHPESSAPIGDFYLESGGQQLSLPSIHERVTLLEDLPQQFRALKPLVFSSLRGDVVLSCPLTQVPLTGPMASAAGLSEQQLQAMVKRESPLGFRSKDDWLRSLEILADSMHSSQGGLPVIANEALYVAVGGSSVAGFSSAKTALEKKQFPRNELHLAALIRKRGDDLGHSHEIVDAQIRSAIEHYRQLGLAEKPKAPWFGILERLGIEKRADVDIQIHSAAIDRVMTLRGHDDPSILMRRQADRLKRWNQVDVEEAFPALRQAVGRFHHADLPVDLEFLGPEGDILIQQRTAHQSHDWWRLFPDS